MMSAMAAWDQTSICISRLPSSNNCFGLFHVVACKCAGLCSKQCGPVHVAFILLQFDVLHKCHM